jgi:2-phospho-L-lactate/phosphoenolpyruvate guanylyltransferase
MTLCALVPIKRLHASKRRLASVLSPARRRALVLAMARDLFTALVQVREVATVAAITADPVAARMARSFGVRVLTDGADDGYNAAVAAGSRALAADGARAVLTLPIDIPLSTPADIARIVAAGQDEAAAFVVVPSRDWLGTNAALRAPPCGMPPLYGPHSFHAHCAAARRIGLAARILILPRIALDIDTPGDLAAFRRLGGHTHTKQLLAEMSPARLKLEHVS